MNKYMYSFKKATYLQQLWFTARMQVMCNSILLTLEALLSLLKETKTVGKNIQRLGKTHTHTCSYVHIHVLQYARVGW